MVKGIMLLVKETYTEVKPDGRNIIFGDSGDMPYETGYDNKGDLYRALRKTYGRCISKIYIDTQEGPLCETIKTRKAIGWVFLKRDRYENSDKTYLRETWVEVHESKPEVVVTNHYAAI